MPRQTASAINAEIVDRAATLFARHGFGHASLQQVADAVGYTKAGVLHHFPSKQAIYAAVEAVVLAQLSSLASSVADVPIGYERDLAVVTSMVDLTVNWPGVSEFANALVRDGHDLGPDLEQGGLALLTAFGVDLDDPDDDRLIRIVSVCTGLTATTLHAVNAGQTREWRDRIIAVSMNTLGHSPN